MSHVDPEALYDGSAGTAVALAEAGRLLGRDRWRELAADIFTPLVAGTPPISVSGRVAWPGGSVASSSPWAG